MLKPKKRSQKRKTSEEEPQEEKLREDENFPKRGSSHRSGERIPFSESQAPGPRSPEIEQEGQGI